ncbi:uncharacterized protein PITG_19672 [Phytophthora infestans T30-4]|uniref:Transmembrane protein n=2 Tax=Phytophthora infestans TaxID=4787 RepID=D0P0F6_PHYIT|nr:uncharacterized protein PITG_19672 [Phytophthora infestans T30-4]EEY52910.1 hypothetical protein PITG_19672 [Phytophthora infestans T30-4]KAF4028229.1 hypothetical protein GN244_ATG20104 [Phytophthora infestans]KAF4130723.1 hypothetical protein GN958_ATG20089 [Phytophthora infestans]KAI9996406.1 hypothetical protein PInf_014093 [Phytophthora infestans]|eukprot:XP_002896228.1 hypothetical protein PITG_19672 [Phytophthora infestans T30-4]
MSVGAEARKRALKAKGGNGIVFGLSLVVAAGFFSIPFVAHYTKGANLTAQEKPLNASQIRRGAYANSGSRDAGADPDWDLSTGTYHDRRGSSLKHSYGYKHPDE